MSADPMDIRDHLKPPQTVGEFIDRALADPKERRDVERTLEQMRAEQDLAKICLRCGRKSGFTVQDGELASDCCGWGPVDPSHVADATS